jgi:TPR repeat protein
MGRIYFNITDPENKTEVSIDLSALAPGFTTAPGYTNLAWMYETGDHVPQDLSRAAE